MSSSPSESQLIKIWQHLLLSRTGFISEWGEPIEIIYPGRINGDQGPDFRDVVIATSKGLIKGDIEEHVKSSGWQEHCYHRDAVYNRVILHVVMWHNTRKATNLENGKQVPILALSKYIKIPISQWPDSVYSPTTLNMPCLKVTQRLTTATMGKILDRAGEERFLDKAARFQGELPRMEASQSLYQGIMGALGYSKNKLPMLTLARRLPLKILESITQGEISYEEGLVRQQALLLGTAGLLPSQLQDRCQGSRADDQWVDELEKLWYSSRHTKAMSHNEWHLFKIRPNNSPIRRLAAMSYLLLRYRGKGILEELVSLVQEAPLSRGYHRLKRGLLVTTDGYWANHSGFDSDGRIRNPNLLGSGRAADIAVNVLLPFTFAWGKYTSQPQLERRAFDLYHRHNKLAVNSVERHMMAQLGLSSSLVNSAQRQQGLIHIYKSFCTQGRCNNCYFGG
ncbi:DUF2851 family protein [Chloroflexota bacterium]